MSCAPPPPHNHHLSTTVTFLCRQGGWGREVWLLLLFPIAHWNKMWLIATPYGNNITREVITYITATVQTLPRGRYKAVSIFAVNTNFVASGFSVFLFTLDKKTEAWLLGPLKKSYVFSNFENKILHLFSARFIFYQPIKIYFYGVFVLIRMSILPPLRPVTFLLTLKQPKITALW